MKLKMINKMNAWMQGGLGKVCLTAGVLASAFALTSCEDFFDQESEYVIYEEGNALNNPADTIYSVIGIANKLQVIADRTILLGEVRGDLVDVTDATNSDLRDVATFKIASDNKYNNPRDYYAVINNCNYFIAKADTALKNNRNEAIFLREYAAVKGFRAWTYLQLAINYGEVPFVTTPILTKEESDATYPVKGIKEICEWLLQDLQGLEDVETPKYGTIRGNDSRLFYFPIRLLQGELNLWAENYKAAAKAYYDFINKRNGMNSYYATSLNRINWHEEADWNTLISSGSFGGTSEAYGGQNELITMIPGDSIPAEGVYSELRGLYNTYSTVGRERVYNGPFQLTPSAAMIDLSRGQQNCVLGKANMLQKRDTLYVPFNIEEEMRGDLRMYQWFTSSYGSYNGERIDLQSISKFQTRNVHIYRRTMVYLRMAEALNRAGYPLFAFKILSSGVNNKVIEEDIMPFYSQEDSLYLSQFDFPTTRYILLTEHRFGNPNSENASDMNANTMGLHSRGSGWTPANKYYQIDTTLTVDEQILQVEDMIVDEGALEFALEGIRYYDLMRVAMRRTDNPAYLRDKIYGRKGKNNVGAMQAEITTDLLDQRNWFMKWYDEIGIK